MSFFSVTGLIQTVELKDGCHLDFSDIIGYSSSSNN